MSNKALESLLDLNSQLRTVKSQFDQFFESYQKVLIQNYQQMGLLNNKINNVYNTLEQSYNNYSENHRNLDLNQIEQFKNFELSQIEKFKDIRHIYDDDDMKQEFDENYPKSNQSNFVLKSNQKQMRCKKRGQYQKYPLQIKKKAIDMVKDSSIDPKTVAKELNIPIKNLLRWLQLGAERKKGGGRKTQDPFMEEKLYQWMMDRQKKGIEVTANDLKRMSMKFINEQFRGSFKASKGWLEKFLKRNQISNINKDNYGKIDEFINQFTESEKNSSQNSQIFHTEQSNISHLNDFQSVCDLFNQ